MIYNDFMESQSMPIRLVEDELWIAQNNVKEFKQALDAVNNSDILVLRNTLRKIDGGVIKHPFGYYEIPHFADIDEIKSVVPFRFTDDNEEGMEDVHGRFDWKDVLVRKSDFELKNRINTVVCGKFNVQSEEQVLEHEIRHGLEHSIFGMYHSVNEGFALATLVEYKVGENKDWERDPHFWKNIFMLAQEKGFDDVEMVKKWAALFEVKYIPATDDEEYTQGRTATQTIIKELGGDRSSDLYVANRKTAWTNYRYSVYKETKRFLEDKGVLKLRTLDEIVEDYTKP